RLEHRRVEPRHQRAERVDAVDHRVLRDRLAVDADALAERHQMRRGVEADALAGRPEHGGQHRRHRALAVRAAHLDQPVPLLAVTPPVVGSVRTEMYGSRCVARRSSADEVLAICIRDRMPSCMRAPPDAETITTGRCLSMASSIARVSFSPTTEPMLPPRKPNSKAARTAGCPPMRAMPQTTASSVEVFWTAARTRSRYFLVSLKVSGSVVASPV